MTAPEYQVRTARHSDVPRLVAGLAALQEHLESSNPEIWHLSEEARARLADRVRGRLGAPDSCALVADHPVDGVVGLAFGRVVESARTVPPSTGTVDQFYVWEDHRRRGVGSRLLAGLLEFFASRGAGDLSLRFVHGNREAAGFWAAFGFTPRIVVAGAALAVVRKRLSSRAGTGDEV